MELWTLWTHALEASLSLFALNFGLNILLIPGYGITGAAAASLAGSLLLTVLLARFSASLSSGRGTRKSSLVPTSELDRPCTGPSGSLFEEYVQDVQCSVGVTVHGGAHACRC